METYAKYEIPRVLSWGAFELYNNLFTEKETYRVGCISDGSCFFHALFTALDKNYRSIRGNGSKRVDAENERKIIISEERCRMSNKITLNNWQQIQNGVPVFHGIVKNIREQEKLSIDFFKTPSKQGLWVFKCFDKNLKQILLIKQLIENVELFNLDNYEKNCINSENKYYEIEKMKNIFINSQITNLIKLVEKKYSLLTTKYNNTLIENTIQNYKKYLGILFDKSVFSSYTELIDYFKDTTSWIGTEYLDFISNQYNINIIIISGITGLPYESVNEIKTDRNTIFLLHVDDTHFECLGFKKDDSHLKCKLEFNDPICESARNILKNKNVKKESKIKSTMDLEYDELSYDSDNFLSDSDNDSE
jgi:hypothetical protein